MDDACRRLAPNLSAYFDGELKGASLRKLTVHLESCQDCTDELAKFKTIRRALQSAAKHTGTVRALAKEIMTSLEREEDQYPC